MICSEEILINPIYDSDHKQRCTWSCSLYRPVMFRSHIAYDWNTFASYNPKLTLLPSVNMENSYLVISKKRGEGVLKPWCLALSIPRWYRSGSLQRFVLQGYPRVINRHYLRLLGIERIAAIMRLIWSIPKGGGGEVDGGGGGGGWIVRVGSM